MIVRLETPNKAARLDKNGKTWTPDVMVYHIAEGYYEGTIGWEQNPKSGVSSHFVVAEDGRISQLVPLELAAFTQGLNYNWTGKTPMPSQASAALVRERAVNPNCYCISIEFAGFWKSGKGQITPEQVEAAVEIERYCNTELRRLYGYALPPDRAHHIGHCEINPVNRPCCPGERFPYAEILRRIGGTPPAQDDWQAKYEALRRGLAALLEEG